MGGKITSECFDIRVKGLWKVQYMFSYLVKREFQLKRWPDQSLWPKPLGWHIPNSCSSTSRLTPLSGSTTRNPLYLETFSQLLKDPTWAKQAAFKPPGRPQAKLLMIFLYKPKGLHVEHEEKKRAANLLEHLNVCIRLIIIIRGS